MSTAERIRQMLQAGMGQAQISAQLGVSRQRISVVRWLMVNPGKKTEYSRSYRARNYDAVIKRERARDRAKRRAEKEKKRAMTARIRALERELRQIKRAQRPPKLISGPAHWYG